MPTYPSDMDHALLCGPYVLGDLQEQPYNLHAPPSTSDCGSLTMPISPSEYDDATAEESKNERKDSSNSTSAGFPMQHTKTRDLNAELGKDGVGRVPSMEVPYYPHLGVHEIKQEAAIENLAAKYGITDTPLMSLPISPHVPLAPAGDDDEIIDYRIYLIRTGESLHVSQVTRPNISFDVGIFTRFSAKPTRPHMDAAVNCVRYTQVHVSHHRLTAEDISGVCHVAGVGLVHQPTRRHRRSSAMRE